MDERVTDEWLRNVWRANRDRMTWAASLNATQGAVYQEARKYLWLIESEMKRRSQRCETCKLWGGAPLEQWGNVYEKCVYWNASLRPKRGPGPVRTRAGFVGCGGYQPREEPQPCQ